MQPEMKKYRVRGTLLHDHVMYRPGSVIELTDDQADALKKLRSHPIEDEPIVETPVEPPVPPVTDAPIAPEAAPAPTAPEAPTTPKAVSAKTGKRGR